MLCPLNEASELRIPRASAVNSVSVLAKSLQIFFWFPLLVENVELVLNSNERSAAVLIIEFGVFQCTSPSRTCL